PHLLRAVRAMYGRHPARSLDYGRMVSDAHFERVRALIDDDKAVLGGTAEADPATRYLPPTILEGVDWDDPVMGEETFGPGPPRRGTWPSHRREVEERFAAEASSGSLGLGLTLAHVGSVGMPFGGVGASGMGAYHGRTGVEAFTHAKPVVRKPLSPDTLRLV